MDKMLKFDWLRAGPYACVRTGVWTGSTSVHNNKGKLVVTSYRHNKYFRVWTALSVNKSIMYIYIYS